MDLISREITIGYTNDDFVPSTYNLYYAKAFDLCIAESHYGNDIRFFEVPKLNLLTNKDYSEIRAKFYMKPYEEVTINHVFRFGLRNELYLNEKN